MQLEFSENFKFLSKKVSVKKYLYGKNGLFTY